ncbi:MAG: hypothetical protein NPIRA05_19340 [Nitrospirales bacterium]|nr:MAG: hypothetical protein NPIRA05_19340 [Nitrospirales bacterium]
MDLFEFILIITSIIYALAFAQILSGIGRLVQTDAMVRWFAPHTLWVAILFVWLVLVWWSIWEFRSIDWTFPGYVYTLIPPTLIFFASSLLVPGSLHGEVVDLRAHFLRIRRPFLGSYGLATAVVVVDGSVLADEPLWFPGRIGHIAIIGAVFVGLMTEKKRTQVIVASIILIALTYIAVTRFWIPR